MFPPNPVPKNFLTTLILLGIATPMAVAEKTPSLSSVNEQQQPNIVWILVDDMSCHFGYQGENSVATPNVDRLAREGVVFSRAYATAPVCSTFRSALITGMYQTSINAHHHRSSRGKLKIQLPEGVRTIPELFKEAGYFTTNSDATVSRRGKEDYNFDYESSDLYDGIDWRQRKPNQPFFAQVQLRGGKHRNIANAYQAICSELPTTIDPESVEIPPYYPDHPVIREDWAAYLDSVNYTDIEVGRIIERLKQDDCLNNTIIFFLTDHGISHARGKQFLYEEGVHIPLVAWGKALPELATRNNALVAHIDLAATSLDLAGIELPESMQGRSLFDAEAEKRTFLVSARDRCDETVDYIRSIRQGKYKYIRNYLPQRPYLQPSNYKDAKPFMPVLRQLYAEGKLNPAQSLIMAETRPKEELYNLNDDPWEINNLATNLDQTKRLKQFRKLLGQWQQTSNDHGRDSESEAMYDSDMKPYVEKLRSRDPHKAEELEANISLMKKWQQQGK